MVWQLQEAENQLGRIIQVARTSGPQSIAVRGEEAAVLLSIDDYRCLTARRDSLAGFLRASPWAGIELDVERSPEAGRDIEL